VATPNWLLKELKASRKFSEYKREMHALMAEINDAAVVSRLVEEKWAAKLGYGPGGKPIPAEGFSQVTARAAQVIENYLRSHPIGESTESADIEEPAESAPHGGNGTASGTKWDVVHADQVFTNVEPDGPTLSELRLREKLAVAAKGKIANEVEQVRWAAEYLEVPWKEIPVESVPCSAAVALLAWAKSLGGQRDFFTQVWKQLLPTRNSLDQDAQYRDDGRKQLGRLEGLLADGYGEDTSRLSAIHASSEGSEGEP